MGNLVCGGRFVPACVRGGGGGGGGEDADADAEITIVQMPLCGTATSYGHV